MSKPKKKVTYERIGKSSAYAVLVDGQVVASTQRGRTAQAEEWSAFGHGGNLGKVVHGASTRDLATKAILTLLEIE